VISVPAGAYTWVRGALINRAVMDSVISDLLFGRDPSLTIERPARRRERFRSPVSIIVTRDRSEWNREERIRLMPLRGSLLVI
jgi:hypothetical protein